MHTQAQKAPVDVLHIVNIGYSASGMASYINVSRRLVRWMKQIQLPRTALRMRYVRLIHAYHVLDGSCSLTDVHASGSRRSSKCGWRQAGVHTPHG